MRIKYRRYIIAVAIWTSFGFHPALAEDFDQEPANLRGYTEINRILKERIIRTESSFELGKYLGESVSIPQSSSSLLALLGTYVGADMDAEFRNGDPNSVNMLLWYLALSAFSQDIGRLCVKAGAHPPAAPVPSLPVTREFMNVLRPVCSWPAPSARDSGVLLNLWLSVTQFDSPMDEYNAWLEEVQSQEYASASPPEAVSAMILMMLYNPHFLLRK